MSRILCGDGWEGNGAYDEPAWLKAEREREAADRRETWESPRVPEGITEEKLADRKERHYGYRFQPIDSATFATANYRPTWLIMRLLVRGQPCIVGGPRKALKTSLLVELAISLGSGLPFLGQFPVNRPVRVAILSGESGEHTLLETALRICRAKNIDLASVNVLWDFRLPQLASPLDLAVLRDGLKAHGVEVLIIDPLYLCLLAGQGEQGLKASNLFDMGPLLLGIARACLDVGATPILIHHARKNPTTPHEPMELEDLAFAGFQEFARQWLLLSRREKYEPGSGLHKLWLSAGGSVGHGGLWALDISEGILDEDFGGRRWEVTVTPAAEVFERAAQAGDAKKKQRRDRGDKADDAAVLVALDKITERLKAKVPPAKGKKAKEKKAQGEHQTCPTKNEIRLETRLSGDRTTMALMRLTDQNIVEEVPETIRTGKNYKVIQQAIGYRRRAQATERTERTDPVCEHSVRSVERVNGQAPLEGRPSVHSLDQEENHESGPYGEGY